MDIKHTQKFIRMSPRKLRLVTDSIRRLSPAEALEILPLTKKRAAEPLLKAIKAAVGNAKDRGLELENLAFKEIQIGQGPRYKRGRAVSRGAWHPVIKYTSHIRIVLAEKPKQEKETKKKEEKK